MEVKRTWFERPLAAICMLLALTILSLYILINSKSRNRSEHESSYRIIQRHYGSDAAEMERMAAIPLEDALSAIQGIDRIVTVSENDCVRAFVYFQSGRKIFFQDENYYYDALREAAQKVYETLPSSAQRPEISSSGDFHFPFWTAAVYAADNAKDYEHIGALLERTVKPALKAIEGTGDVEISGSGIKEIIIAIDGEKAAALGLSPADISRFLSFGDGLFPAGHLDYENLEIPILTDARYTQPDEIGDAIIPLPHGGSISLKSFAEIREQERDADTISRLNGERTAIISITASSGAEAALLSKKIKEETAKLAHLPLKFHVLEDRGAAEAEAFISVLAAAFEASALVAAAAIFMKTGKSSSLKNGIICACTIPAVSVISAACILTAGFPVNGNFLAGIAVGLGAAVDAVIMSAGGFGRSGQFSGGRKAMADTWPSLVSGGATTIAALLPLSGISGGVNVIAVSLGTVTFVSVVISLFLLPPLFLAGKKNGTTVPCSCIAASTPKNTARQFRGKSEAQVRRSIKSPCTKKIKRFLVRRFARLVIFCDKRAFVFPAAAFLFSGAALISLTLAGADTSGEWSDNSVYVQIEFESGFLKEKGDPLLASWARKLKKYPAITEVQTGARTGSGYALVTFDSGKSEISGIRTIIRSEKIPGAFIYISESSPDDRVWNIIVAGDDAGKCREIARGAASVCSSLGYIKETVLNFKEGAQRLNLIPRREILAAYGMSFSFPADTVRRGIYGHVAYKRNNGEQESDVRIRFDSGKVFAPAFESGGILQIPIAANGFPGTRINSIMRHFVSADVSGIRRENRRRTASFSIRTAPGDPRFFRDKIAGTLKNIELPPGYRIDFDPEAVEQADSISEKFSSFFWAAVFCYMIIAAAGESFMLPLIILSSVFPSIAFPVLALTLSGTPVNISVVCALVAVSGMTVNASVISAEELWRTKKTSILSCYLALRKHISVLLAVTATTTLGALPFLFLRDNSNALARNIALVTVLGVSASFICSLTLIPSLTKIYFRFCHRRKGGNFVPDSRGSTIIELSGNRHGC